MNQYKLRKNRNRSVFILFTVVCLFLFPLSKVVPAEETKLPTIEELTDGKIKVGDLVTKENVELVKEYLSVGVYEAVKKGMVLEIGKSVAPYEIVPQFFREATERNLRAYGEPVVDEGAVVYTKDGKPWPGGLPFPDPQNALEVIANYKYGHGVDDMCGTGFIMFVNKEGKAYKSQIALATQRWTTGRLSVPPLGAMQGMENTLYRDAGTIASPFELRGVGQLAIRYWDEVKNADKGFAYIASFKRIIRISATTYQDNFGGSDLTWGDMALREPSAYWNFKLVGKKVMLASAPYGERPVLLSGGTSVDPKCEFTEGKSFAKHQWALEPIFVIEAIPKIKHIYGKKVLYAPTYEYWPVYNPIKMVYIYDRQLQLWKAYNQKRFTSETQGETLIMSADQQMYDLQTGHSTIALSPIDPNCGGDPAELTLKYLIQWGK